MKDATQVLASVLSLAVKVNFLPSTATGSASPTFYKVEPLLTQDVYRLGYSRRSILLLLCSRLL